MRKPIHVCFFACVYDHAGLPIVMSEWLVLANADREVAERRATFVVRAEFLPNPQTRRKDFLAEAAERIEQIDQRIAERAKKRQTRRKGGRVKR